MSKAEDFAIKKYPVSIKELYGHKVDVNLWQRKACVDGYHQAEKDLELTCEDIKNILDIEINIFRECNCQKELVIETYPKGEDYYGEILKRFQDLKK